jgi:HNH endonuclease
MRKSTLAQVEDGQVFVKIDGIDERYTVNRKGDVYDSKHQRFLNKNVRNGKELIVKIKHNDDYVDVWVKKIILMGFSPLYTDLKIYTSGKLTVGKINAAGDDYSYSNLYWIIPEGGIECRGYKGYYSIPGNPEIVVNKNGDFIEVMTGKKANIWYPDKDKNQSYPLLTKRGNWVHDHYLNSSSIHRLVCLAFHTLPHPESITNHIDGRKENYSIDNLEWVNHTENRIHAVQNGLCVQSRQIYFHNVITKQEFSKASLWDAARCLGLHATVVGNAIESYKNQGVLDIAPFILTYSKEDLKPFDQRNLKDDIIGKGPTKYYKVEHNEKIGVQYVRGRPQLAAILGVPQNDRILLCKYLSLKEFELYGYVITPVHREEVPEGFSDIVHKQAGGGKVQKPISVTDLKSGITTEYPNTDAFATLVGALRKTIQRRMLYNNGVWNGYKIEYLK